MGITDWFRGGPRKSAKKTPAPDLVPKSDPGRPDMLVHRSAVAESDAITSWERFWARRSRKGFLASSDAYRAQFEADFSRYAVWLDRVFALLPPGQSRILGEAAVEQALWQELVHGPFRGDVFDKALARILADSFWPAVPGEHLARVRESFGRISASRPVQEPAPTADGGIASKQPAPQSWESFWAMRAERSEVPFDREGFERCVEGQAKWLELLLDAVPAAFKRPVEGAVISILREKLVVGHADEASVLAATAHVISTYFWPCFGAQQAEAARVIIARSEVFRPRVSLEASTPDPSR